MLKRMLRQCSFVTASAVLLSTASVFVALPAYASTSVTINGSGSGRTFEGVGIVNSSGTSKLLYDYPANQQSDILDFLFKPNFGAGLTVFKNEIGGDMDSSSGAEPSHQRTAAETPTARGANFWMAAQAKTRYPSMKYEALRWGLPAWVATDTDKKNYYLNYLSLMAANGTPLDFLGPEQNEGSFNRDYVVNTLKPALTAGGYSNVKLVAADAYNNWNVADTVVSDTALSSALYAISSHYIITSTANAQATGKPLYSNESDTPMHDDWTRTMYVAGRMAESFTTGKMVRYMYQPALDGVYDTLQYQGKGILTANTPWSGHYDVNQSLWMTAQFTQFAPPGWKILDGASGKLDANNYYITFKDPNTTNYSVVIVNTGTTATDYAFTLQNVSTSSLNVWRTTQSTSFSQLTSITPSAGAFSLSAPAQSVTSLTTTTGQTKGTATYSDPADTPQALTYTDNFNGYATGAQMKYAVDQQGAFEVVDYGSGNKGLRQVIATKPQDWMTTGDPYTTLGDTRWSNYQVSADVKVPSGAYVTVSGRANLHNPGNYSPSGYQMQLFSSGNWYFRKVDNGVVTNFANGTVAGFSSANWYNVKVAMNNNQITAYIGGTQVATTTDATINSGQVAFASKLAAVDIDNLKIEPITTTTPSAINRQDSSGSAVTYTGTWADANGTWQDYGRTLKTSSTVGASLQYTFTGTNAAIIGRKQSGAGTADVYIDGVLQTTINTANTAAYYREALYQKAGLSSGSHTIKLVVKTGTMYVDAIETS
ncbi:hypothetical protein A8709_06250 [Paenibacillus pectinilyticus]|uniref:galactosylceramidase n=1 Tax=Paenibacillus pectinilyticus TaxID=512399 RepID=A0A1C0ZT62_9BACL|nr:family 16 glycoside hydrolase [Paenibacillus pectinilyticus]OCT11274.1 hypothetical protein A8709_06250 [Paenibacillus pectinilyticus]